MDVPTMSGGAASSFTTKYQNYIATFDANSEFSGAVWMGQIFKVAITHTLTGIKLPLFNDGTKGITTISVQALSGGDPDGTDITVTTFNEVNLPTSGAGALVEIPMPPVVLTATISYGIVLRSTGSGTKWESDGSSPTYTDGQRERSTDSGGTWTALSTVDMGFEEWGFV